MYIHREVVVVGIASVNTPAAYQSLKLDCMVFWLSRFASSKFVIMIKYFVICIIMSHSCIAQIDFQILSRLRPRIHKDFQIHSRLRPRIHKDFQILTRLRPRIHKDFQILTRLRPRIHKDFQILTRLRPRIHKDFQILTRLRPSIHKDFQILTRLNQESTRTSRYSQD